MRKFVLVLLCNIMWTGVSHAKDIYPVNSVNWETSYRMNRRVYVRSRKHLTDFNKKWFLETYRKTKRIFFEYYGGNANRCDISEVDVRVIDKNDLSNREYFPCEAKYSTSSKTVVGRYYKWSNVLYIIFPDKPIWEEDFAHELIHYWYDDCGMRFPNSIEEHAELAKVMRNF